MQFFDNRGIVKQILLIFLFFQTELKINLLL